jgi:hypothetical protein
MDKTWILDNGERPELAPAAAALKRINDKIFPLVRTSNSGQTGKMADGRLDARHDWLLPDYCISPCCLPWQGTVFIILMPL